MESSNPLWSPIPGHVDGSGSTSESTRREQTKRNDKNHRIEDAIMKHIDGLLSQQDLETPSECAKKSAKTKESCRKSTMASVLRPRNVRITN